MTNIAYVQQINGNNYKTKVFNDPLNKRLRIDDYRGNVCEVIKIAEEMAVNSKREKLLFISRQEHYDLLLQHGFHCEAKVDGFFRGSDAYYFTKYYYDKRRNSNNWVMEDGILQRIMNLHGHESHRVISTQYHLLKMEKSDAIKLSQLYRQVFKIYPTPLHDPEYIEKTMEGGTIYYGITNDDEIVSCASAEINFMYDHAELTDCATLPDHRKYGLMKKILEKLETELRVQGIYCVFSIARAQSYGMNAVLHQIGFKYRGRLLNNCYIFDKLENMNMWVKDLSIGESEKLTP
ncbi:putative beta-lysine N-acetyltransferase [Niallia sp. Krafla_26]